MGQVSTRRSRREDVLSSLVHLFCSEGFVDTNLNDLAARLRCSKSTLYALAPSREQLISAVVREFFRRATERVEASLVTADDPQAAVRTYLEAISVELAAGSQRFFEDLDAFAPAREIYTRNTRAAARRVQGLVHEVASAQPSIDARFLGFVAGAVMESINVGRVSEVTGLDHASAYRSLADLIAAGATTNETGTS